MEGMSTCFYNTLHHGQNFYPRLGEKFTKSHTVGSMFFFNVSINFHQFDISLVVSGLLKDVYVWLVFDFLPLVMIIKTPFC